MSSALRWVLVLAGLAVVAVVVAWLLGRVGPSAAVPLPRRSPADRDRLVDEELDESFPASDAPSHWAGGPD